MGERDEQRETELGPAWVWLLDWAAERGSSWARGVGLLLGWAGVFFLFLLLFLSNSNSNSTQTNSNLNLNSHKHSTNKTMLQHDATTKFKPMINFNYL